MGQLNDRKIYKLHAQEKSLSHPDKKDLRLEKNTKATHPLADAVGREIKDGFTYVLFSHVLLFCQW